MALVRTCDTCGTIYHDYHLFLKDRRFIELKENHNYGSIPVDICKPCLVAELQEHFNNGPSLPNTVQS